MLSSTVFVVDVSPEMDGYIEWTSAADETIPRFSTKLEVALQGIKSITEFLVSHNPWETTSLFICSDAYRSVFGPGPPQDLLEHLSNPRIFGLAKDLRSNSDCDQCETRYLALLAAAREGTHQQPSNNSVFIFTSSTQDPAAMQLLRSYPDEYREKYLLPPRITTPVILVDLDPSSDAQGGDSLLQYISDWNRSKLLASPRAAKPPPIQVLCGSICRSLYSPWRGKICFMKTEQTVDVCMFPNPWGLKGSRRNEPAPAVILTTDAAGTPKNMLELSWVLPVQACPPSWRNPEFSQTAGTDAQEWTISRVPKFAHNDLRNSFADEARMQCIGPLSGSAEVYLTRAAGVGFEYRMGKALEDAFGKWLVAFRYKMLPEVEQAPTNVSDTSSVSATERKKAARKLRIKLAPAKPESPWQIVYLTDTSNSDSQESTQLTDSPITAYPPAYSPPCSVSPSVGSGVEILSQTPPSQSTSPALTEKWEEADSPSSNVSAYHGFDHTYNAEDMSGHISSSFLPEVRVKSPVGGSSDEEFKTVAPRQRQSSLERAEWLEANTDSLSSDSVKSEPTQAQTTNSALLQQEEAGPSSSTNSTSAVKQEEIIPIPLQNDTQFFLVTNIFAPENPLHHQNGTIQDSTRSLLFDRLQQRKREMAAAAVKREASGDLPSVKRRRTNGARARSLNPPTKNVPAPLRPVPPPRTFRPLFRGPFGPIRCLSIPFGTPQPRPFVPNHKAPKPRFP